MCTYTMDMYICGYQYFSTRHVVLEDWPVCTCSTMRDETQENSHLKLKSSYAKHA